MVISQQERTERFILKQNIFFKNPLSLYTIPRNNHGHWLNSRNSVFKLFKTYIFIYFFYLPRSKKKIQFSLKTYVSSVYKSLISSAKTLFLS